jgi:DNA-binding transcriptional MerR regulator
VSQGAHGERCAVVTGRSHLSIGEVLSLLKDEFPDVTISKIRFLESQGLVDPERTPSGYRKFYEDDIERLRWVLRQQRDAFLPLKVIKGRLSERGETPGPGQALGPGQGPEPGDEALATARAGMAVPGQCGGAGLGARPSGGEAPDSRPGPGRGARAHTRVARRGSAPSGGEAGSPQLFDGGPPPPAAEREARGGGRRRPQRGPFAAPHTAGTATAEEELSLEELVRATGAEASTVHDLERYALISPRFVAGAPFYGADAAVIVRLAAAFARYGVEARHLRAYKGAAEREAGMVQQVVMPLIKQRNPEARRAAAEVALELSRLGGELREALLRSALGDLR